MSFSSQLFGATATLALLAAPDAFAQTATPQPQTATPQTAAPQAPPQAQPQAKASKEADTLSDVVVVGQKAQVVTSIDRKTYNVARDIQSVTGSVSDVLRNLPSVDVDLEGNVSLRGQGVQILVDGKPSSMFSGAMRATALQQLPANTLESIEVMSNPSAEFKPDGGGGVINLVTKKVIKVGKSGSLQGSVGSFGKWSSTAVGSVNKGPVTVTGNLAVRSSPGTQTGRNEGVRTDPILGARTTNFGDQSTDYVSRSASANVNVDYDRTPKDRITVSVGYFPGESKSNTLASGGRIASNGTVLEDLDVRSISDGSFNSSMLSALWRHTYTEPGRLLLFTGRYSRTTYNFGSISDYDYDSPQPDRIENRDNNNLSTNLSLSANYTLPLANKAVFKTGYDFQKDGNDTDLISSSTDPVTGAPIVGPNLSNNFVYAQTNHQAFATYQRPFGKLSVLAGLRLEEAAIEYDQRTTAITGSDDYFQVHPSLHLQYDLAADHKLSLSYSHRVQRPSSFQLNPFVTYYDEFNASSGNPNLRPQETHSVEAGWQWTGDTKTLASTFYYRENYNTIGNVSRYLTPLLILSTYENQGTSSSSGVEFTTTGKLGTKLSYNLGGNLYNSQITRSTLAGGGSKSAFAYTAKGNIDYRFTPKDFVQMRLNYSSKQINSQGYRKPSGSVDLGYQRKIRPDLIAVLTVNDIFESVRYSSVTDTPSFYSVSDTFIQGRTFSIGITRQFGGKPVREGQFDYSGGGAAPAGVGGAP